jgi:hypothetical protein
MATCRLRGKWKATEGQVVQHLMSEMPHGASWENIEAEPKRHCTVDAQRSHPPNLKKRRHNDDDDDNTKGGGKFGLSMVPTADLLAELGKRCKR